MKFLKIFLIVVVVLILLALIGGYIFLKTFDINKYKPVILEQASAALGRDVQLGAMELQVSLKEGIRLKVEDILIAEAPEFQAGDLLKVKTVYVGVDLLSLITKRQVLASAIEIFDPQITVIRDKEGTLNVQRIGPAPVATPQDAMAETRRKANENNSAGALPFVFINTLQVHNAAVTFIDKTGTSDLILKVHQADITVDDFSLNKPFTLQLDAAVLAAQRNVSVKGEMNLDLAKQGASVSGLQIKADITAMDLSPIRTLLKQFGGTMALNELKGQGDVLIKEMTVSAAGLGSLRADIAWQNGAVDLRQIAPGIDFKSPSINLKLQDFSLDQPFTLDLQAAYLHPQPNIFVNGSVQLDILKQGVRLANTTVAVDLATIPFDQLRQNVSLLKDVPLPQSAAGKLSVQIKELNADAKGTLTLATDVLLANGMVDIKEVAPGISFKASHLDLQLTNFSLTEAFAFSLKAAYLSETPNINTQGTLAFDVDKQSVRLNDTTATFDLAFFSLAELRNTIAALKDVPLPQALGGKLDLNIKEINVGPKGLGAVLMSANLTDGLIDMKELSPGVGFAMKQIALKLNDFSLQTPFTFSLAGAYLSEIPNIAVDGKATLNMTEQSVKLQNTKIKTDLSVSSLDQLKTSIAALKDVPLPQAIGGNLDLNIKELSAGAKGLTSASLDIQLTEGLVDFKELAPGVGLAMKHIGLTAQDLSLKDPFAFSFKTAYLSDVPNISVAGKMAVDMSTQNVTLADTKITTDLSTYSFDQLKASIASLKDVPLPQKMEGKLSAAITQATLGPKGLLSLNMQGGLAEGMLKLKELALPMEKINAAITVNQTRAELTSLTMALGEGTIEAKAAVDDYLAAQIYTADLSASRINLAQVIDQKDLPVKVQGFAGTQFHVAGEGFDPVTMMNKLTGNGMLEVTEGRLKDLNVLRTVIDKISIIPNLRSQLENSLPESYRAKLENKDTILEKVQIISRIQNGTVMIDPMDFKADGFIFLGDGRVGFDQSYSLAGNFSIEPELTASMVQAVPELQNLLNQQGQIYLPLTVSGKGAAVKFGVDLKDIGKNVLRQQATSELRKVLDKVLPQQPQGGSGAPATQQGETPVGTPEEEPSIEEEIIGNILDSIFK